MFNSEWNFASEDCSYWLFHQTANVRKSINDIAKFHFWNIDFFVRDAAVKKMLWTTEVWINQVNNQD